MSYADKSKLLYLAQIFEVIFVFYDLFEQLCAIKGVSVTKATIEIGLSRTIGTKWKNTGATPQGETLNKIADYFGVSTDYLLGKSQSESQITFNDFTYAMFNESKELTEEDKSLLLQMARQLSDKNKKGGKAR